MKSEVQFFESVTYMEMIGYEVFHTPKSAEWVFIIN